MTNLIPKNFIQDVVARTDIVAVVEARVELKKRGTTHIACCPFHSEKTPSFTVSQIKQFYYCFGCGAHGNVIGFLMAYDHLTFVDAVTDLAQQLGLTVPLEKNDAQTAQFDALYKVLQDVQKIYQDELKKSPAAIDYLKNRGLTGKIAKDFGVGYAPNSWDFLSKKFPQEQEKETLVLSGMLIKRNDGSQVTDHGSQTYARFRDRILFPIRDARGRTIGFGGRTLTQEIPKYLNSPETPIFHKNQVLYGLYEMCQHSRKLQRALIVEGYLDVISLAQHDIHYAVATLGTAFNIKHTQLLLRYTSDIIFCFDGDAAGRKAAWKALTISLPLLRDGIHLRVLFLPLEEDPDSLVRKIGKAAFEKLIEEAHSLSAVFFEELAKTFPLDSIANKAAFAKAAHEHINTMSEGIYKNLLLDELAKLLAMKREKITQALATQNTAEKPAIKFKPTLRERLNPTQLAIQLLLHHPEWATAINECATLIAQAAHENEIEKIILHDLIKRCLQNPALQIGTLLEELSDSAHRALIAAIATYPIHIPLAGRQTELRDALQHIQKQEQEQQLSNLIAHSKNRALNLDEKKLLQTLLAKKQTATIRE